MDRRYYLDLAANGLCMPIGADLLLQDYDDHEAVLTDGRLTAKLIEEAATRFRTPLAVPRMDLEIERKWLLTLAGLSPDEIDQSQFRTAPGPALIGKVSTGLQGPLTPRAQALVDAIGIIARDTDLLPTGMAIGPFSLMTRLLADPIPPVFMAGAGIGPDEDDSIRMVEEVLEAGLQVVLHYIRQQIDAGAKAIFIAEPAANVVFFSPAQIEAGSDTFDRYVMTPHRRIRALLAEHDVDLVFHCCGEITERTVRSFASLDPAILSLGSSRNLWEDAALVPKTTVLYGNLPSKHFYSDNLITLEEVAQRGQELIEKMREVGHPFILGSECDVLSVPGSHETILKKAEAITACCRSHR